MSLYMTIELIEFSVVVQRLPNVPHLVLFWGGGNDKVCLGVDIYG